MATSLALALATAAITACGGGGSSDVLASTQESATSIDQAASDSLVSTNTAAVVATTTDTNATTVATTAADTSPTTVAAADSTADPQVEAQAAVAPNSTSVPAPSVTPPTSRPAGNTGSGFYVVGSKLYDAKGKEFRIRGVNRTHWDNASVGLPLSGANAERIAINFTKPTSTNMGIINSQMLAYKIVPMPGNWTGTCKSDPATLVSIVDTWVAQAPAWTALNSNGLINIANEWGPPDSTIWRDGYITAIARMRAAGYTGTLVVDSGGCGQDAQDVVKYGPAVLASDPQKNILFDVHVYGSFHYPATASWMQDYSKAMAQMKASGLPIMLGEFGPGKNIGPSPTLVTPQQVIATAEAAGWGWMPWAWDDNNLPNCMANDNWFSMTVQCGRYKTADDLTTFGKAIVPMMQSMAVKASIFN